MADTKEVREKYLKAEEEEAASKNGDKVSGKNRWNQQRATFC